MLDAPPIAFGDARVTIYLPDNGREDTKPDL
jgi:hypothetical protein